MKTRAFFTRRARGSIRALVFFLAFLSLVIAYRQPLAAHGLTGAAIQPEQTPETETSNPAPLPPGTDPQPPDPGPHWPGPEGEEDNRPAELLPQVKAVEAVGALEAPAEHPFLLVKRSMYTELRGRAGQPPWAGMQASAIADCNALSYDPALTVEERAWRMRDITSACGLASILDPANGARYRGKLLATYPYWDDLYKTLDPLKWVGVVPQGAAFFNSLLSLDIIHDDLSADELAQAESKHAQVGEWFWTPGRTIRSEQSFYATQGIWALYQGDRGRIDSAKKNYRRVVFEYITPDGIYTNSVTYAQHRFSAIRDAKAYFMDVLEFTGEDKGYYTNPRLKRFFEWDLGQALTPFKKLYTIGDTCEDYAPAQNEAASYRAHRFSAVAAGYAAWLNQGLTPQGRLITYLLHDQPLPAARPPESGLDFNAGAWLYEPGAAPDSLSAALWNPIDPARVSQSSDQYSGAPAWSHPHKDVNAVHLAAYGEHVLRNSGYAGSGKDAGGSSWTYIHSKAESSNTVMIDGVDHNGDGNDGYDLRVGGGLSEGLLSPALDYASGNSGPALPNGTHQRNLVFVHAQDGLPGYFVLFDEVQAAGAATTANVILHPNANNVTTRTAGQEYQFRVGPYPYSSNEVYLTIFQGTPPGPVTIKDGGLASWDSSFAGKYLYSNYPLNSNGAARIVTVLFPHDRGHPRASMSRVAGSGFTGASVGLDAANRDVALEANGSTLVTYGGASFKGRASLYRLKNERVDFYFVRQGVSFSAGQDLRQGFEAGAAISLVVKNKSGALVSPGTGVKVYYPQISGVRLNGAAVSLSGAGAGWVSFNAPAGRHTLEIESPVDLTQVRSVTLYPLADAEVRADNPAANLGGADRLGVDYTPIRIAYLKFDLTGLNGVQLNSAALRLKVLDGSSSTQNVKAVDPAAWEERTVTYNNRPALGELWASFAGSTANAWQTVDLSGPAAGRLGQVLSFGLDSSGGDNLVFGSKEGTTDRPELVVTYLGEAAPGPSPTPAATATPGATVTATATASRTPGVTVTATATATPTRTPGATVTATATPAAGGLVNPSFEVDADSNNIPDNWTRANPGSDDRRIASTQADGSYIYQISPASDSKTYRGIYQALSSQSGKLGDTWEVTVWVKAGTANPSGNLRARIAFRTSSGAERSVSLALPKDAAGGYYSVALTAPVDYVRLTVYLESSLVNSYAYFDNVGLKKR